MAAISRWNGIVIALYNREHGSPHFHARYSGMKASIRIDPPGLLAGSLPPRQLGQVIEWAALHADELLAAWDQAATGHLPGQIPPLA